MCIKKISQKLIKITHLVLKKFTSKRIDLCVCGRAGNCQCYGFGEFGLNCRGRHCVHCFIFLLHGYDEGKQNIKWIGVIFCCLLFKNAERTIGLYIYHGKNERSPRTPFIECMNQKCLMIRIRVFDINFHCRFDIKKKPRTSVKFGCIAGKLK